MKVAILSAFTGYPEGKRTSFPAGPADIPKEYVDEADLVKKGLVRVTKASSEAE